MTPVLEDQILEKIDIGDDTKVICINPSCRTTLNRYHKINNHVGLCHACETKRAKEALDWDAERIDHWQRLSKFKPIVKELPTDLL